MLPLYYLIDIFFHDVAGEMLELGLSRAQMHSRFVMCGGMYFPFLMISVHNDVLNSHFDL